MHACSPLNNRWQRIVLASFDRVVVSVPLGCSRCANVAASFAVALEELVSLNILNCGCKHICRVSCTVGNLGFSFLEVLVIS